jgi:hypothetical protein
MCPECVSGAALVLGSVTSAGGVTALLLNKLRTKFGLRKSAQPHRSEEK